MKLIRTLGILALLAAPLPAFAQVGAPPTPPPPQLQQVPQQQRGGIGVGVKGGVLFSTISDAKKNGLEGRSGIIGGLFLGGNRTGVVGVGVDLLYARKGVKDPDSGQTVDLDYINVPVYLRINLGSQSLNKASVYLTGGADLNFLLKAKGLSVNIDQFNRADYGYMLGAGVEITRFLIEARYSHGLGNLAKADGDLEDNAKSQSFAFMVGFRFN